VERDRQVFITCGKNATVVRIPARNPTLSTGKFISFRRTQIRPYRAR